MSSQTQGCLYLIPTPLGNLGDITYRAVEVLRRIDIVAAEDTRVADRLLTHLNITVPQKISFFTGNERMRSAYIIDALKMGKHVAVMSDAGTPTISDPGQMLIKKAIECNIAVVSLPGPVAGITALVASGLPTDRFLFVGFLPKEEGNRHQQIGTLRQESSTMIFYESPHRVLTTLQDMREAFGSMRKACVAREITKIYEEYLRGTINELIEQITEKPVRGECMIIVEGCDDDVNTVCVEDAMNALLKDGVGLRDSAARLVIVTGKSRRELYQLALSLQRKHDSST